MSKNPATRTKGGLWPATNSSWLGASTKSGLVSWKTYFSVGRRPINLYKQQNKDDGTPLAPNTHGSAFVTFSIIIAIISCRLLQVCNVLKYVDLMILLRSKSLMFAE
jgi:hypothetical protein